MLKSRWWGKPWGNDVGSQPVGRGITVLTQKYIASYVSGPMFVKIAIEFNPNIYHLAVYIRL